MLEIIKDNNEIFEVSNGTIRFKFFKLGENQGNYEIYYKDIDETELSLKNCYVCTNFHQIDTTFLKSCTSLEYSFENTYDEIDDDFGLGLNIKFRTVCASNQFISFKIQVKIYEENNFLLIKIIDIVDNTKEALPVHSISPLIIKNSNLWLSGTEKPTNLHKISWFKNGWQSWSPCKLLYGTQKDRRGPPVKLFNREFDNQDYKIKGRFYSEYCTALNDLESHNSLILGFTTLKDQFSRFILDYNKSEKIKILTAFGCMDGVKLPESTIDTSEELFITFKTKRLGYYGLIEYAKIIKSYIQETRIYDAPIGWCSWYYYYTRINQDEIIKNLEFFKKNKENFPVDFIQLDDGYFTKIGDYKYTNSKFPNGLGWLYNKIIEANLKGGIWTAPFFGTKKSELFNNHPDWFIKKKNSKKYLKTNFNPFWGWFFEYTLDLTNKDVLKYLQDFFSKLLYAFQQENIDSQTSLINFFKIDFIYASVPFNGHFKDTSLTRAQLYHNGIKAIRQGITDDSFLLGCGAPLGPCVGLVDAMRIGPDTASYWKLLDKLAVMKFGFGIPSLKRALLATLYRSFMHKYFWVNDPDCLMLRRTNTKLNYDEIKLQLTIFGLSGGQLLISDDMSLLTEDEINDAKLLIPPYNPDYSDPVPTDAFFSNYPTVYVLQTDEDIGERYLVSIINWDDKSKSKLTSITDLIPNIPDDEKKFLIYDFWNQQFLGEYLIDEELNISDIHPHSCRYFSIIPIDEDSQNEPILLTSSLHITQGCCEITDFNYDADEKKLMIIIDLQGTRKGDLILKLPEKMSIMKSTCLFTQIDKVNNLWQLSVDFEDNYEFDVYFQ